MHSGVLFPLFGRVNCVAMKGLI